jgi:membrane associated rhomboid family serine protease
VLAQTGVNHTPFIVFGLVTGVIWAVVCYRMAKKKGREPGVAAMLGLLFGIFAVIGYAAVKPRAVPHAVFVDPRDSIYWCETCGQHSYSRAEALAHGGGFEPPVKPWSTRTTTAVPPAGGVSEPPPRPDA